LAVLFVFMIINFADKALLGIAAQPIMKELGMSPSQYGLVSSGFFFLFSLSSLVVGFLTMKFPTKKILIAMALTWTIAQCIMFVPAAGFMALFLTRILLGAGEGPSYGLTNHSAMKWFPASRRGIATAAIGVAVPTGTMIAAPLVGQLVAGSGWRSAFLILGIASLVWAVIWAVVGKEGPFDGGAVSSDPSVPAKVEASVPFRRIILSRTFIGSLIGGVAAYWSVVLLISWVPPYLATTQGLSPAEVGAAVAAPWGVQILAIVLIGGVLSTWLIKRGVSTKWARGAVSGAAVVASGVAMIAFIYAPAGMGKTVLMVLAFGLGSCVIPIAQALNAEISPVRQRGAILGIYVAVYSFTGVIAPAVTGALVESASTPEAGYNQMFLFSGALLIVGGILCAVLVDPGKDREKIFNHTPITK
jgi:MFS family permease